MAPGCSIIILRVGAKVFLPTFEDPANDESAVLRFGEVFRAANVIPVPSLELSRGGGVQMTKWQNGKNVDYRWFSDSDLIKNLADDLPLIAIFV